MKSLPFLIGIFLVGAMALAACAKKPESVASAYVSPLTCKNYSCTQLAEENTRVEQALVGASAQQRTARSNDTIGVIFPGLPVSSLSGGNVANQIAQLKSEQKILQQTMIKKNCSSGLGEVPSQVRPQPELTTANYTALPSAITPPYEGM